MSRLLTSYLTVVYFALIQTVYAGPPTDSMWKAVDFLTDEFHGPGLDTSKWHGINPNWRGRLPSQYSRNNVQVLNGELLIHTTSAGIQLSPQFQAGTRFLTGTIVARKPIRYGYFEIKAKAASSKVSSAFWLYNHEPTSTGHNAAYGTEIDIFEVCGIGFCARQLHTNVHFRDEPGNTNHLGNRTNPQKVPVTHSLSSRFFTAALEWTPEALRWYLDGVMVREIKNDHWHRELYLVVDSEVMADWFGLPDESELPAHYTVDYVKVWQRQ